MYGSPTLPETSIIGYGMGWWRASFAGHGIVQHNGSVPGFSAQISFFPYDGFGVITLVNTHSQSITIGRILERVMRNVLGLNATHLEEDSGNADRKPDINCPIPSLTEPPFSLDFYAGTYRDVSGGYPAVTFCHPSSTSYHCLQVLADFDIVYSHESHVAYHPPVYQTSAQLFTAWPRFWSTHLRFIHMEGHRFYVAPTTLFTAGYGEDMTPFDAWPGSAEGRLTGSPWPEAEFVVENGTVLVLV